MARDFDSIVDIVLSPVAGFFFCFIVATATGKHPALLGLTLLVIAGWCLIRWRSARTIASFPWHEQIVVVTGANGGLGQRLVERICEKKCRGIVCVDLHEHGHPSFTRAGDEKSPRLLYVQCDVGKWDEMASLADRVRAHFDGAEPTVVISNAGMMLGRPLLDLQDGEMQQTLSVNFMATYHCVRAFLPAMLRAGHGHILATASVMGYVGVSRLGDYVASKHALVGLMESLRFELDKVYNQRRIHTSLLILGQLATPLFARVHLPPLARFLMPLQDPDKVANDVVKSIAAQQNSYIYRPYLARLAPIMPSLPVPLRNLAQQISGADESLSPC